MATMVERWQAADGSLHDSEINALQRDFELAQVEYANALWQRGETLETVWLWTRVVSRYSDLPEALKPMTKDTGIVISHWQCSDELCYHVYGFSLGGYFRVYGAPKDRLSGGYGREVALVDLVRYVEQTQAKAAALAPERG